MTLPGPRLQSGQTIVLWPEQMPDPSRSPAINSTLGHVDNATGRLIVEEPYQRELVPDGARLIIFVGAPEGGPYYRHFEVAEHQKAEAESASSRTWLMLQPIDDWQRIERRQADRSMVSLDVEVLRYAATGGFAKVPATVRNISVSGLLLETTQELGTMDDLRIDIPLPDGRLPFQGRARVVRVITAPTSSGERWFAGCRFEGLQPADQERLRSNIPRLPASTSDLRSSASAG